MKNPKLLVLCVILASLVPALAVCALSYKSFGAYSTGGRLASALELMAQRVESQNADRAVISNQLRAIADADREVEKGVAQVQVSYYWWALLFGIVAVAQGLLMRSVVSLGSATKTHITKSSKVTPESGAL